MSSNLVDNVTAITSIIGAVLGTAGFVTGGYSLWLQHQQSVVRLKISPHLSITIDGIQRSFSIADMKKHLLKEAILPAAIPHVALQISNLSVFPISIADAGFSKGKDVVAPRLPILPSTQAQGPEHIFYKDQEVHFPVRLESRESMLLVWDWPAPGIMKEGNYLYGYVRTSCGTVKLAKADAILNYCFRWSAEQQTVKG